VVNTRFSCLSTRDANFSFVPRWRPKFISSLAAEDRCHLNGLAMREGRPRYVTALGESDARAGWREKKASRGCLIDVESGEIISSELSIPHSPRWHERRLWVSSGIPFAQKIPVEQQRACGVWVVDTRNGQNGGFFVHIAG